MTKEEKLAHIERIIMSCETYDQIRTCFSFANDTFFGDDLSYRYKVTGIIQKRTYEIRNRDMDFHISELKRIKDLLK